MAESIPLSRTLAELAVGFGQLREFALPFKKDSPQVQNNALKSLVPPLHLD